MKSKGLEEALASSQTTSSSEKQLLKSLASSRNEKREIAFEAHPKGEPQYLPPYLIPESKTSGGKQVFTTDTY